MIALSSRIVKSSVDIGYCSEKEMLCEFVTLTITQNPDRKNTEKVTFGHVFSLKKVMSTKLRIESSVFGLNHLRRSQQRTWTKSQYLLRALRQQLENKFQYAKPHENQG